MMSTPASQPALLYSLTNMNVANPTVHGVWEELTQSSAAVSRLCHGQAPQLAQLLQEGHT